MGNWFGNLNLAYKYTVVFVSLLVLTLVAGFVKVFLDRRKLKKLTKAQANVETGQTDDQVELNQREKDEGDLFGVRAIEAGFYAGIPQSRPTSRAGSYIDSPSMSTHTLIGTSQSMKKSTHSESSSVTTLPVAHVNHRSHDSDTLPSISNSPPRGISPPAIRLAPSVAELNGRINHSADINMNLTVAPSPVVTRVSSPAFDGSESGESDGRLSPGLGHYTPAPPQIPMPEGLRASYHPGEKHIASQAASLNDPSPSHTPGHSGPPSPRHLPEAKKPTMPGDASDDELYYQYFGHGSVSQEAGLATDPASHRRDRSDASSVYNTQKRQSMYQHDHPSSYNFSFPRHSRRNSAVLGTSSFLDTSAPSQHEPSTRRPGQLRLAPQSITEVVTPLSSPVPHTARK